MIRDRELVPGEKLGSERGLAASFGISRSDLRVAIAVLEGAHEVVRRIGRGGGVMVADQRIERNFNTNESLPVIARRQGFVLSSVVLRASIAPASPSDVRLLELDGSSLKSESMPGHEAWHGEDRPMVYDIARLRLLDGEPLSVETTHLPAALFPGFLTRDLTQPFYTMFEQHYDVHPESVDETMEIIAADEMMAQQLHVAPGTSLVRIRRVTRDIQGRPCERAVDCYRADRMRFTMHHSGYVRLSATRR